MQFVCYSLPFPTIHPSAEEGFRGLYKGMSFPLFGTVLETATLFTANGALRRTLVDRGHLPHGADLPIPLVFLSGSGSGFFVSFVLTPIELVKCRLQVQTGHDSTVPKEGERAPFRGPVDCLVRSVRDEGLGVLYRGHTATLLREIPGTGMWFTSYEMFIRAMLKPGQTRADLHPGVVIAAGALGGCTYWGIMYPMDTVKSAMQIIQTGAVSPGTPRSRPPAFLDTLALIYRSGGLRGLYSGLLPTLVRAAPANAAVFLVYEHSIQAMAHW